MKHRAQVSTFGRKSGPRKALIRGLVNSLVEHGRITTTVAKAKELRRHVERAITMGKKNTLHSRRLLLSRYPLPVTVERIMDQWAPHFKDRAGGYTRIIKVGRRLGDSAELAMIELLDYTKVVEDKDTGAAAKKSASKGAKKAKATGASTEEAAAKPAKKKKASKKAE